MSEKIEYERKFLVSVLPSYYLNNAVKMYIEQTYLAITTNSELRIRLIDYDDKIEYTQTYKENSGSGRKEVEYNIIKEMYDVLLKNSNGRPLFKDRYSFSIDGYHVDLDQYYYNSEYGNLVVVEVEFNNEEEMNNFKPYHWFGEEITHDKYFSNKNLWKLIQ